MSFVNISNCTDRQLLSILKTIINELTNSNGFKGGHLLRSGYNLTQSTNIEPLSDGARIKIFSRPSDQLIDGLSNKEILSLYQNLFSNACNAMEMNYGAIADKFAKRICIINTLVEVDPAYIDDYDLANSDKSENGVYISCEYNFSEEQTIHELKAKQIASQPAVFKPTIEERAIESFESSHRKLLNFTRGQDGQYADGKTRALWNSFNIGILHNDRCRQQELTLAHQAALEAEFEIESQIRYLISINGSPMKQNDIANIRENWALRHIPEEFSGLCDTATQWIDDVNPFEDEGLYSSNIKSVLLVGSHAKGLASPSSDFDVAIIYSSSIRKENNLPTALKLSELMHASYGSQMPTYCNRPVDIQIFFDDDKELTSYSMIPLKPGSAYQFYDDNIEQLPPIAIAHKIGNDAINFENMCRYDKKLEPLSDIEKGDIYNNHIANVKSGAKLPINESYSNGQKILKKNGFR